MTEGQIISIGNDRKVTAMDQSLLHSIYENSIMDQQNVTQFPNLYKNPDTILKMNEYEENEAVSQSIN